jgi:hypothetical protein
VRVVLGVVLVVWCVPWIAASLGLFASDLPLLGHLVRAHQPTPGEPALPSVHRGLHEGLFGVQLSLTALALSRPLAVVRSRRARLAVSLFLALMLCYGLMVAAQDGWNEQFVKRGWTTVNLPNVLVPAASLAWLGVIVAALCVHVGWFRREHRPDRPERLPL